MPVVRLNRIRKVRLALGVQLHPGDNMLDAAAWEKVAGHPVTQLYLNRGEIVVASDSERQDKQPEVASTLAVPPEPDSYKPENPPLPLPGLVSRPLHDAEETNQPSDLAVATAGLGIPPDLETMRARDVIEMVNDIDDVKRLRNLLTVETRTTVVRAIEQRIDVLRG